MNMLMEQEMDLPLALYHNLNERFQRAYAILLNTIPQMKPEVQIPLYSSEELLSLYSVLCYDYPQIEFVWNYKKSRYFFRETENNKKEMCVELQYAGSYHSVKQTLDTIERKAEQIVACCLRGDKITDEDMVRRLCSYMAEHYRYTTVKANEEYPDYAYTLECLLRGDGVCAGFSKALTYMLRRLQIPVMSVSGQASGMFFSGHAWNIVQHSDGTYWHIDLTWDLQQDGENLRYFELDDGAMRARRHYWNGREYPMCG